MESERSSISGKSENTFVCASAPWQQCNAAAAVAAAVNICLIYFSLLTTSANGALKRRQKEKRRIFGIGFVIER